MDENVPVRGVATIGYGSTGASAPVAEGVPSRPVTPIGNADWWNRLNKLQTNTAANGTGRGVGTVTSVGLVAPTEFAVSGTPVTSAGTLTLTKATQSINQVWASPSTGLADVPSFRALVAADLPTATSSALGIVKPDNSTITISAGVLTATGTGLGLKGGLGVNIYSNPTTGLLAMVQVPYAGTITGWTILLNASGSAQFDVKKSTYSGFPTVSSIVASAPPVVTSATNATSTTLTGWTTAIAAGDCFEFFLTSVSTATILSLTLNVTRS